MPGYNWQAKRDIRFEVRGRFLEVLNRAVGEVSEYIEYILANITRRRLRLQRIHTTSDGCIGVYELDLTEVKSPRRLLIPVYVSAQETPLRPVQIERIHRRVSAKIAEVAQKTPVDVFKILIATKLTSGAQKLAQRLGYRIASSAKHALKIIIDYFTRRLRGFLASVRGKKLFRALALFPVLLKRVIEALRKLTGIETEPIELDKITEERLVDAALDPKNPVILN